MMRNPFDRDVGRTITALCDPERLAEESQPAGFTSHRIA
jgi:hypothetical protein